MIWPNMGINLIAIIMYILGQGINEVIFITNKKKDLTFGPYFNENCSTKINI